MREKIKINFGIVFCLFFILLFSNFVSSALISNPQYVPYSSGSPGQFDESMCREGTDFMVQIVPFGCSTPVVRSDLLEEQDVNVFCQLGATQINPLIDVEAIDSITFSGELPKEIAGIGFYPAKAALSTKEKLNYPVLDNIGYVVITLKQQKSEALMPDFVQGNLTANLRYDIKNAMGIGSANFYLPILSEDEWNKKAGQYSFWGKKAYLRVEDIGTNYAVVSLYDSNLRKISGARLQTGQTSGKFYLPGFHCLAGLQLKLDSLDVPDTRAKLRVNADVVEVARGERFLENRCEVRDIGLYGLVQKVTIMCNEDEKGFLQNRPFVLSIEPKVKMTINEQTPECGEECGVGDVLYSWENYDKKIFLGYIGQAPDGRYFVIPVISPARTKEQFLNSFIAKNLHTFSKSILSGRNAGVLKEIIQRGLSTLTGGLSVLANFIATGSYPIGIYYMEGQEGEAKIDLVSTLTTTIPAVQQFVDSGNEIPNEIKFVDFAIPDDVEINTDVYTYYENALKDFDKVILDFPGEKYPSTSTNTLGEEALYNKILLMNDLGQKREIINECQRFRDRYPNSKEDLSICDNGYVLSNSQETTKYVLIRGKTIKISFDGIYEPTLEDYSAEIFLGNAGDRSGEMVLGKNQEFYVSEDEFIVLKELRDNYAVFDVQGIKQGVLREATVKLTNVRVDLNDFKIVGDNNYRITLTGINLKKSAKVSVIPSVDNTGSKVDFGFKIGIEKRFNLMPAPDKIKQRVQKFDEEIKKWEGFSEKLGKGEEALSKACLVTGGALVLKNLLGGLSGETLARQTVMRGTGGWYDICGDLVNKGDYNSVSHCLASESNNIDRDVNKLKDIITKQNEDIKNMQQKYIESTAFQSVVNSDKSMDEYSKKVNSYIGANLEKEFLDPSGKGENINLDNMQSILSNPENYNIETLRNIELYAQLQKDTTISNELREMANQRLYSDFLNLQVNHKHYGDKVNLAEILGVDPRKISFFGVGKDAKEVAYEDLTAKNLYDEESGLRSSLNLEDNTPIQIMQSSEGNFYLVVLDASVGTDKLTIKRDDDNKFQIYDLRGDSRLLPDNEIPGELKKMHFKKYDAGSYKNQYKNPEVRFYETEPYKGMPAIVPFDLNGGWYAATKPTLPVLGNIRSFDESGRVSSFWLCNVGRNGREEFNGMGDDNCQQINLGTGQPYNQFSGLSETEAVKRVSAGVRAIEQAASQYRAGARNIIINVGHGDIKLNVGKPAVEIPEIQCQDFMSPKDCLLMFNVCDPVICPSSRCDLGGAYPVKDVAQSGILGSLILCFPNIQEGIVVPICLSGVKAGIDGWVSIKMAYRDCLQHSLDTGEVVGICDKVYSVYLCEFFWRQALPVSRQIIPSLISKLAGQGARGGGEYMTVQSAWSGAQQSMGFFTKYYQENAPIAFKTRTAEEFIGDAICKVYSSAAYPDGGDILSSLTRSSSPPQFHGRFDEIPFTTVTVPPTSQYKVFYHIFAGKSEGAYYQVYLRGDSGSFYQDSAPIRMVDSGYIPVGEYASDTPDFTAPAGYKELCINVNGQEECGFRQVSTSFAVDFIEESYLSSRIKEEIKTEAECVSGRINLVSPELYNKGIIRVCSTESPGKGTDVYFGTDKQRWISVGYCGSQNVKCWLDRESVRDVIDIPFIRDDTLQNVTDSYLRIFGEEDGYITTEDFEGALKDIEDKEDANDKISRITQIIGRIFYSNQRAYLHLLRGNAYVELARRGKVAQTSMQPPVIPPAIDILPLPPVPEEPGEPSTPQQPSSTDSVVNRYKSLEDLFDEYAEKNRPNGWTKDRFKALLVAIAQRQSRLGYSKGEFDPRWVMEYGWHVSGGRLQRMPDYVCEEGSGASEERMRQCTEIQIRDASKMLKLALNKEVGSGSAYHDCNGKIDFIFQTHLRCVLGVYLTGEGNGLFGRNDGKEYANQVIELMNNWEKYFKSADQRIIDDINKYTFSN